MRMRCSQKDRERWLAASKTKEQRAAKLQGKRSTQRLKLILRYQSSWSGVVGSGPVGAAMAAPLLNILADRGHTQQLIACMHVCMQESHLNWRIFPSMLNYSQVRRHQKEHTRLANISLNINLCDHINSNRFIHNIIATCVALASARPVDVQTSSLVILIWATCTHYCLPLIYLLGISIQHSQPLKFSVVLTKLLFTLNSHGNIRFENCCKKYNIKQSSQQNFEETRKWRGGDQYRRVVSFCKL